MFDLLKIKIKNFVTDMKRYNIIRSTINSFKHILKGGHSFCTVLFFDLLTIVFLFFVFVLPLFVFIFLLPDMLLILVKYKLDQIFSLIQNYQNTN